MEDSNYGKCPSCGQTYNPFSRGSKCKYCNSKLTIHPKTQKLFHIGVFSFLFINTIGCYQIGMYFRADMKEPLYIFTGSLIFLLFCYMTVIFSLFMRYEVLE